jgi:hypothetical protein
VPEIPAAFGFCAVFFPEKRVTPQLFLSLFLVRKANNSVVVITFLKLAFFSP